MKIFQSPREVDGFTMRDIALSVGKSDKWVREKIIRRGIEDGTIILSGFRNQKRIDGQSYPCPVYKLVTKGKT